MTESVDSAGQQVNSSRTDIYTSSEDKTIRFKAQSEVSPSFLADVHDLVRRTRRENLHQSEFGSYWRPLKTTTHHCHGYPSDGDEQQRHQDVAGAHAVLPGVGGLSRAVHWTCSEVGDSGDRWCWTLTSGDPLPAVTLSSGCRRVGASSFM